MKAKNLPKELATNLPTDPLYTFRQDLQLRGMAQVSIKNIIWAVRRYLLWANQRGTDPEKGRREDLLAYLGDLRARKLKQCSLQKNFSCLSVWLDYLVESGQLQQSPMPAIQKRYLNSYKDEIGQRKLISVEDAAKMVSATIDTRDRAILLLLLKTGIRRNELITLDLWDINLQDQTLMLKPTAKRSNRLLFFDGETALALHRWIRQREMRRNRKKDPEALFITYGGARLKSFGVAEVVQKAALRVGLHDPVSKKMEERFSPHACRHWFTTHLRRAGMPREFIQELRGDVRREAIDIYDHIDKEELRRSYLAHIPQLGV